MIKYIDGICSGLFQGDSAPDWEQKESTAVAADDKPTVKEVEISKTYGTGGIYAPAPQPAPTPAPAPTQQ